MQEDFVQVLHRSVIGIEHRQVSDAVEGSHEAKLDDAEPEDRREKGRGSEPPETCQPDALELRDLLPL